MAAVVQDRCYSRDATPTSKHGVESHHCAGKAAQHRTDRGPRWRLLSVLSAVKGALTSSSLSLEEPDPCWEHECIFRTTGVDERKHQPPQQPPPLPSSGVILHQPVFLDSWMPGTAVTVVAGGLTKRVRRVTAVLLVMLGDPDSCDIRTALGISRP